MRERQRNFAIVAVILIATGVVLRAFCAILLSVAYDEVHVMGVGLDEGLTSAASIWTDLPVRRSDAITPLWWWVQAIPAFLAGHVSLFGLRLIPFLAGSVALVAVWRCAPRRIGRGPTVVLLALMAFSDLLLLIHGRGEYAESLLVPIAVLAALHIGTRRLWLTAAFWTLLLMTHLGKGVFLVGMLGMAELLYAVRTSAGGNHVAPVFNRCLLLLARIGIAAVVSVLIPLAWLLFAKAAVFSDGVVVTDAGPRSSIWQAFGQITFGYAETKRHVISSPLDSLQPYLDGVIWPATTWFAVPLFMAAAAGAVYPIRHRGRIQVLASSLIPWAVVGLMVVVSQGMLGGRFHLLYLPAWWILAAVGFRPLLERRALLAVTGAVWCLHLLIAFGWQSWADHSFGLPGRALVAAGLGALGIAVLLIRRWPAIGRIGSWACCCLPLLVAFGPIRWGPAARMEPHAGPQKSSTPDSLIKIDAWRSTAAPFPPASGRSLYIDLANLYLRAGSKTPRELNRALLYSQLETERAPFQARAWFYLGWARQEAGRPVEEVREAWERAMQLEPTDMVRQRLEELPQ